MSKETHQMSEVIPYNVANGKWYRNHLMDLSVLFAENDRIKMFELNYTQNGRSYLLKWSQDEVLKFIVDKGEQDIRKNNSPLVKQLMTGPNSVTEEVIKQKFSDYSVQIPTNIRHFILANI